MYGNVGKCMPLLLLFCCGAAEFDGRVTMRMGEVSANARDSYKLAEKYIEQRAGCDFMDIIAYEDDEPAEIHLACAAGMGGRAFFTRDEDGRVVLGKTRIPCCASVEYGVVVAIHEILHVIAFSTHAEDECDIMAPVMNFCMDITAAEAMYVSQLYCGD